MKVEENTHRLYSDVCHCRRSATAATPTNRPHRQLAQHSAHCINPGLWLAQCQIVLRTHAQLSSVIFLPACPWWTLPVPESAFEACFPGLSACLWRTLSACYSVNQPPFHQCTPGSACLERCLHAAYSSHKLPCRFLYLSIKSSYHPCGSFCEP